MIFQTTVCVFNSFPEIILGILTNSTRSGRGLKPGLQFHYWTEAELSKNSRATLSVIYRNATHSTAFQTCHKNTRKKIETISKATKWDPDQNRLYKYSSANFSDVKHTTIRYLRQEHITRNVFHTLASYISSETPPRRVSFWCMITFKIYMRLSFVQRSEQIEQELAETRSHLNNYVNFNKAKLWQNEWDKCDVGAYESMRSYLYSAPFLQAPLNQIWW